MLSQQQRENSDRGSAKSEMELGTLRQTLAPRWKLQTVSKFENHRETREHVQDTQFEV